MYLFPRLFGISTYILLILFTCGEISKFVMKDIPKLLFICNGILFIMAYFYCVTYTDDLYRLLPIMHMFADLNNESLWIRIKDAHYPILVLFYRIVGSFHNDRLLPAITSLISYSFFFKIISRTIEIYRPTNKNISIAFYLFMARGLFVIGITNVRTIIVISIFAYLVFEELAENQPLSHNIPMYITIALFHNMGMFLVILRFIYYVVDKNEFYLHKIRYISILLFTFILGLRYGNIYLNRFSDKALRYVESANEGNDYDYIWERIISVLNLIIIIYIIYHLKAIIKNSQKSHASFLKFYYFCIYIAVIDAILFFIEYAAFFRLNWLVTILIVPLYLYLSENTSDKKMEIFKSNILIIGSIMFILECARGYLCSLKYFLSFSELL